MSDDRQLVEAGQRATALLGLYLEAEQFGKELNRQEVAIAMGADENGVVPDVHQLLHALIGIGIGLLITASPDDPRRLLRLIGESYAEWSTEL